MIHEDDVFVEGCCFFPRLGSRIFSHKLALKVHQFNILPQNDHLIEDGDFLFEQKTHGFVVLDRELVDFQFGEEKGISSVKECEHELN